MSDRRLEKALLGREKTLFRAALREFSTHDLKVALATRKWMDYAARNRLSWREALAKVELERRGRPRSGANDVLKLERQLDRAWRALRISRGTAAVAVVVAVVALTTPLGDWIAAGASHADTWAQPARAWAVQASETVRQTFQK